MKFGLVSPVLPPSKSGQAMIINKLLKDTTSSNYFLISRQDYTNNQNNTYYSNKLSGKYYSLPTYDNYIFIKAINKIKRKINIPEFFQLRLHLRKNQISKILMEEKAHAMIACTADLVNMPATYLACKKLEIPFYAYIFDYYSYQCTIPKEREFAKFYEEIILKDSAGVIVPNEFMQEELKRVYGVNSIIVYNCIDSNTVKINKNPWPLNKEEIRIIYTGDIYTAHYDAFHDLIIALKKLDNINIHLHIYTSQSKEYLIKQKIVGKVLYHDHVTLLESLEIQKKADILFLPLAFTTNYPEVIKTSMPGKMGEYLASGRPILVHAPKDSFLSWYFKKNKCGVVVDSKDPLLLAEAINKIIENKEFRDLIIKNALRCAENDFSIEKARKNFFDAINYKE